MRQILPICALLKPGGSAFSQVEQVADERPSVRAILMKPYKGIKLADSVVPGVGD